MKARILFIGLVGIILLAVISVPFPEIEATTELPPISSNEAISDTDPTGTITLADGTQFNQIIINSPSEPPAELIDEWEASIVPADDLATRVELSSFPSYDWVFGSAAVSQAMISAYYDNNGYPNMYTGPENGGVAPISDMVAPYDSVYVWGTWYDSVSHPYPSNPLVASQIGVDGRTIKGTIEDYWVSNGSTADDPYITGAWAQHTWGTAVGDYMKTSQSFINDDGSTTFLFHYEEASPLPCFLMEEYQIEDMDGTYGRKLFYEAQGYVVTTDNWVCYSQRTDNQVEGGFSLVNFQAEIDAGHPVLLILGSHSVVGYGYSGSTIYIRDTWDSDPGHVHTMEWGGSYLGTYELYGVSVVHPMPASTPPGAFGKINPADGAIGLSDTPTLSWEGSTDVDEYEYCFDTTDNGLCDGTWVSTGTSTSVGLSSLAASTTYFWQVRATNSFGTTYANGGENVYWSFTVEDVPGPFEKISPVDCAVNQALSTTLSWTSSDEADEYMYCIDEIDDDGCTGGWISTGTSTSVLLSGLDLSKIYYWQVLASNSVGGRYANGIPTSYWEFKTSNSISSYLPLIVK